MALKEWYSGLGDERVLVNLVCLIFSSERVWIFTGVADA